jgi:hypothetical protein
MATGDPPASAIQPDQAELPGMVATLCFCDNWLGTYHPQTLRLTALVADAYWQAGVFDHARPLLERAVRDIGRYLGQDHDLRLRAMAALRDLLASQGDYEEAESLHAELQRHESRATVLQ